MIPLSSIPISRPSSSIVTNSFLSKFSQSQNENAIKLLSQTQLSLSGLHILSIARSLEILQKNFKFNQSNNDEFKSLLTLLLYAVKTQQLKKSQIQKIQNDLTNLQQMESNIKSKSIFSNAQRKQLHIQLKCYQYTSHNQKIPPELVQCSKGFAYSPAKGDRPDQWTSNPPQVQRVNHLLAADSYATAVRRYNEKHPSHPLPSVDPALLLAETELSRMSLRPLSAQQVITEQNAIAERQIAARIAACEAQIAKYESTGQTFPNYIIREKQTLNLLSLQRRVRASVLKAIPPEVISSGTFRSKREIERENLKRNRQQQKETAAFEREQKRIRREFCQSVSSHANEFLRVHRNNRSQAKKIAEQIIKERAEVMLSKQAQEAKAERDRIMALKANDEEAYFRLLKDAKNERLKKLIKETDRYMNVRCIVSNTVLLRNRVKCTDANVLVGIANF